MRKVLIAVTLLVSAVGYAADKMPVWKDPGVNQQNREPRRAHFFAFEDEAKA